MRDKVGIPLRYPYFTQYLNAAEFRWIDLLTLHTLEYRGV